MSLLHRALLGQIMAAIDPVVESALTVYNPAAGAGSRVLLAELEATLNAPVPEAAPAPAPAAPVAVAGTTINSPLPAAVVPQGTTATAPVAPPVDHTPAPAPLELDPAHAPRALTAQDVIAALMQTLQSLEVRAYETHS